MSRAPRSRIPWLRIALVIPGMAIAAGVIADPVSITAALQGWVLAAIALAIAALALVAARRALRAKKESAAGATRLLDLASTRFDSDGSAHQRVRLALLAVFVTGGAHVLLQAWLDERAESSRSWDSEVMDVAGSQRWHSQRIGRLALLPEARDCVVEQQQQNNGQIGPVPHQQGKDSRRFDHPGDWVPEIGQEFFEITFLFGHQFIATELLQTASSFGGSQTLRRATKLGQDFADISLPLVFFGLNSLCRRIWFAHVWYSLKDQNQK